MLASISHRQRNSDSDSARIFPFKKKPRVRSDGGRSELD